jgi:hypothetical protein
MVKACVSMRTTFNLNPAAVGQGCCQQWRLLGDWVPLLHCSAIDNEPITYESGWLDCILKTVDPCFHFLQAGPHFPILDFCVDHNLKLLFHMVQTNLKLSIVYILAAGVIAPIATLPLPSGNDGWWVNMFNDHPWLCHIYPKHRSVDLSPWVYV